MILRAVWFQNLIITIGKWEDRENADLELRDKRLMVFYGTRCMCNRTRRRTSLDQIFNFQTKHKSRFSTQNKYASNHKTYMYVRIYIFTDQVTALFIATCSILY